MIWDVTVFTRSGQIFERVLCFEWSDVKTALWIAWTINCGWTVRRFHHA